MRGRGETEGDKGPPTLVTLPTNRVKIGRGSCSRTTNIGATQAAGIVRVRTLVLRRQNTVAQFVATLPILALCEGSERRGGTRVPQRWWEQKGINWKLARERTENAETEGTTTDTAGAETMAPAAEATSESDTGSEEGKEGEESLGASGSSGAEWSGAETE